MAQTDARPGFRLPWNSERSTSEQTEIDENGQTGIADGDTGWPTSNQAVATDAPNAPVADVHTTTETATEAEASAEVPPAVPAETSPVTPGRRKPTKFMEDLSKAMQAAAEEARTQTLAQFEADAKGHIENIQGRLTTETADLRRKADDDVAAHREWSKLEIARVREETEGKISARKTQLESEIALHATQIEREVQVVQGRVSEFEAEMASFFERLLAEDDPTRIASMAERLPEPPPFDTVTEMAAALTETAPDEVAEEVADVVADATVADATVADATVEETVADEPVSAESSDEPTVGEAETVSAEDDASPTADGHASVVPEGFEMDREAAFAAVQAAAEAAASAEVATDAANRAETVAEIMGGPHHDGATGEDSPEPDFGAAEVEAAAAADGDNDEITEIGDDDLAARLAGLVPAAGKSSSKAQSTESASTQVVVVGLVSVASIASFKRHLGRVSGVLSVGVSSGPDGEFVFAVHHSADVVLRDAIPSLPSFQARVTNAADGVLNVTAHDPESDPK